YGVFLSCSLSRVWEFVLRCVAVAGNSFWRNGPGVFWFLFFSVWLPLCPFMCISGNDTIILKRAMLPARDTFGSWETCFVTCLCCSLFFAGLKVSLGNMEPAAGYPGCGPGHGGYQSFSHSSSRRR